MSTITNFLLTTSVGEDEIEPARFELGQPRDPLDGAARHLRVDGGPPARRTSACRLGGVALYADRIEQVSCRLCRETPDFAVASYERLRPRYPAIDALNALIRRLEGEHHQGFRPVHDFAGGPKSLEAFVFLFAGNCVSVLTLAGAMCDVKWAYPGEVQLFAQDQDEQRFSEIDWQHLKPGPDDA